MTERPPIFFRTIILDSQIETFRTIHPTPSLKIRGAAESDLDSILAIEKACFDEDTQEEREVYRGRLTAFPEGCFILEYENRPAGFIASELWNVQWPDEDFFRLWPADLCRHNETGGTLYISSIAILPEYRGRKWASHFLSGALNSLLWRHDQIERVLLLVSAEWAPARHLYANMGLQERGYVRDFFGGNSVPSHDAVVMEADAGDVARAILRHSLPVAPCGPRPGIPGSVEDSIDDAGGHLLEKAEQFHPADIDLLPLV